MQSIKLSCFIIFTFCVNVCFCKKYYHNFTLFRGIPSTDAHLEYYKNMSQEFDVNFWREPGLLFKPVEFVVNPKEKPDFVAQARSRDLNVTPIIEDLQEAFDKQTVKTYIRRNMDSFDWNNFFRVDDIYQWLKDLEKNNIRVMKIQSIGKTLEKRDIMGVKILLKGHNATARSKVIIEGGIHAREWIAPAFVTYLIHQIIHSANSKNQLLKEVALHYEWYFVPVMNPDGYEYSFTNDRLWRKNCNGVDLNRNFAAEFGTVGVSSDKASDIYCGPKAFSERETSAMRKFLLSKKENIEFYLAFHSYGQYMIIPYAYTKKHLENFEEVKDMCMEAVPKMAARYKTKYTVGTAYDTVGYSTSGVSGCWVKKTLRVPYVVTFELRDSGDYGFALPPRQILPACKETLDGVLSLLAPRNNNTLKAKYRYQEKLRAQDSAGPHFILDDFVLVFNVFLFIMVRFG